VKDCIQIDRQKEWNFILDMTPNGSDRKEGRTLLFGVETEVKEGMFYPSKRVPICFITLFYNNKVSILDRTNTLSALHYIQTDGRKEGINLYISIFVHHL
jgi:hypothetical protein